MSHDLYASWATSELAKRYQVTPNECFRELPDGEFGIFANRESGRNWPIPDGRLSLDYKGSRYEVAIEMKRTNEGLHGILTAIGQSQAYINPNKGYSGSVIIIPESYASHTSPGNYIQEVLNHVNPHLPIGVYSYRSPDPSSPFPFRNKLTCHRNLNIGFESFLRPNASLSKQKSNSQWAHLREGSSEPDAFFRYLQTAKTLISNEIEEPFLNVPDELLQAVNRINPDVDPLKYLCYSTRDIFHDRVWRNFWINYVLTSEVAQLYEENGGIYKVVDVPTRLKHINGRDMKKFFSGKSNSPKNKIVHKLNRKELTTDEAWEKFAKKIHSRAHSYREDIDSSLEHLDLLESDGRPTELGYKFVDSCERAGNSSNGNPKLILGSTILKNGGLGVFLNYFYKLSEEKFHKAALTFTQYNPSKARYDFQSTEYLNWIKNEMANNLKVLNTATLRGGIERKPFQAELAILRKFDFIKKFRVGVGLEINWPLVQEYLDFEP